MRRISIGLSLLIGLLACGPRDGKSASGNTANTKAPPARIASRYQKDGQPWAILIVDRGLSNGALVALARQWLYRNPDVRANIFDDDSKALDYAAWAENPAASNPFPEAWDKAHHVGLINKMFEQGGPRWQLVGGSAHPKGAVKLADL